MIYKVCLHYIESPPESTNNFIYQLKYTQLRINLDHNPLITEFRNLYQNMC